MIGEVIQRGATDPAKRNIGLYIGRIKGSEFEKSVAELARILGGRYNVFIISSDVKGTGYSAPGTIIDISRGMDAAGLKLTRSSMVVNRVIKEYDLDALVSLSGKTNIANGLYNHSCISALYVRSIKGNSRLRRGLFIRACKTADVLLVPSVKMQQTLAEETQLPAEQIIVTGRIGTQDGADKLTAALELVL